jgi:beta-fructofuranosidase
MYRGHGFNEWGIGDVDVIKVGELYHLFHLFLPNHAYIAHAVSSDGLTWTRVRNALFVGDPGNWDDDMLWTMHVTPDPDRSGSWRMFYTGLARREQGRVQRVGLAVSDDLYTWRKVREGYPLSLPGEHYESAPDEGRQWISFRDPYFCQVNDERWLIAAGRSRLGPLVRRGCVTLAKEVAPSRFEFYPPLYHPRVYDDVEVPGLFRLGRRWYLIGSIREDIKVHYWYADRPEGPYHTSFDNVLLPRGNYAARVCNEGDRYTLWNFYYLASKIKGTGNMLPPPKELFAAPDGQLKLRSFSGFDRKVTNTIRGRELRQFDVTHFNPAARQVERGPASWLVCETSREIFLLPDPERNFRLRATFELDGQGKCGVVLRMSEETDGYFISLDLFKGLVQARASGRNPDGGLEDAFIFKPLQANYFVTKPGAKRYDLELLAYGQYMELSLDGEVQLTFADGRYSSGYVGFYSEGARLRVENIVLEQLDEPQSELHAEAPPDLEPTP